MYNNAFMIRSYTKIHKAMKRMQITLDDELYKWVTKEIEKLRFGSYSHAINYALKQLKESESTK
jgi:Arc/MetJ-type ribon-helix-helix transcriptional regulator